MDRRTLFYIIEWVVTLAACAYLAYRLVTFEDYHALLLSFSDMRWQHCWALVCSVALMPVNMSLEAWRWRTLLPMSWRDAHLQVYYSKLAGLITPWRLGEYPARALLRNEWAQTLSMGAVGSATMTAAIVAAGIAGLAGLAGIVGIDILNEQGGAYYAIVGGMLILLGVALALAPRLLRRWTTVSRRLIIRSFSQSLVRLFCWCIQLGLVLYALGAYPSFITGLQLPIYYLFVTFTPNIPIAEVGVRGMLAITLFGTVNAAFAGVLLWAVNTLLPCLIWPFLRKNAK